MTAARWVPAVALVACVLVLPGRAVATAATAGTAATDPPLSPPGCSTAAATAPQLPVTPQFANVPGLPFDVETTPDGRYTFVSSQGIGLPDHTGGGAILVYRGDGSSGNPLHTVFLGHLPPSGMAFTDHGGVLLVAAGSALVVLDVQDAERGAADAVTAEELAPGTGAIEVAPTRDGRYAFVTMENSDQVDVFRLSGAHRLRYVGAAAVGRSPVGVAFSADGTTAYVTSEIENGDSTSLPGTLSLLRVAVAEHNPRHAVERTVVAGCQPVRVVVSADGHTIWVTAAAATHFLGSPPTAGPWRTGPHRRRPGGPCTGRARLLRRRATPPRRRFEPLQPRAGLARRRQRRRCPRAGGLHHRWRVPETDDIGGARCGNRRHQLRHESTRDGSAGGIGDSGPVSAHR